MPTPEVTTERVVEMLGKDPMTAVVEPHAIRIYDVDGNVRLTLPVWTFARMSESEADELIRAIVAQLDADARTWKAIGRDSIRADLSRLLASEVNP